MHPFCTHTAPDQRRISVARRGGLSPAGTPEKAEPVGAFTLEISTDVKTELYYHCRWTSVKREFSREGLRKTRKGIAMLRQEQEDE